MGFDNISPSSEIADTLEDIYQRGKRLNPAITRQLFLDGIINEWLIPYLKKPPMPKVLPKNKVVLRNHLKQAIVLASTTQAQVAREIGVDRSYLGQVVKGVYEPSVAVALLILQAIDYPPEKFNDLFFLEPIEQV